MMGRQAVDQGQLFYLFNLERRIPVRHLLRRINPIVARILADLRDKLHRLRIARLGRRHTLGGKLFDRAFVLR